MVREDLVSSAVSFLQDPSVAASPLDKRIAFLQSKNLTQEEIDAALASAGDGSNAVQAPPPSPGSYQYPPQQAIRQPAYGYAYGPYQGAPWGQPPPEYIVPLISPPTPPQLEQDKAAIDESFNKAFALIDQLALDTAVLKSSEAERTEKLDTTLRDVDNVIVDLKAANTRREAESRIIADQVQGLKDMVPKALEGWKAGGDAKLEELGQEIQSLKRLLENRIGRGAGTPTPSGRGLPPPATNGGDQNKENVSSIPNGSPERGAESASSLSAPAPAPASGINVPKRIDSSPKRGPQSGGDRRAAIPAWQMAAKSTTPTSSTSEEGGTPEARA